MPEIDNVKQQFNIDPAVQKAAEEKAVLRHDFHRNPQLGFEETYAHEKIKEQLDEWGLTYETMAGTGIVVTLEGAQNTSGRVVALRADMDALSLSENSGVEWTSENEGKMHACGHDGHMASMLAALSHLKDNRDFDGTIKVVFQPAEEGVGGAKQMLKEGLIENHKIDSMYSFHNWPDLPVGKAAIHTGPVMASNTNFEVILRDKNSHETAPDIPAVTQTSDTRFEITLHGKGCHGAKPEQGNNPVPAAFELEQDLAALKGEFVKTQAGEDLDVDITGIQAGSTDSINVIPADASLSGIARKTGHGSNADIRALIEEKAQGLATRHGMTATISFPDAGTPVAYNSDGNNPIPATFEVGRKLGTLKDKFAASNPDDKFVLSICNMEATQTGAAGTIPGNASIRGTVRTYNQEIKDSMPELITRHAQTIAAERGMEAKVNFPNICSPTVNNLEKAKLSHKALAKVIGDENIEWDATPAMTAEDFGEFSSRIPVSYIWIGNADPDNPDSPHNKPLHNPGFGFNDDVMPIAAQYLVNVVKAEMPLTQGQDAKKEFNLD